VTQPVAFSVEVRTPDTNAQLVAETLPALEKRIGFRRAMKNAMDAPCAWAPGDQVMVADVSAAPNRQKRVLSRGTIPLQTLRAVIDYASPMRDTYGPAIGVKVWIYKGEILSTSLRHHPRDGYEPPDAKRKNDRRRDDGPQRRPGGYNRGPGGSAVRAGTTAARGSGGRAGTTAVPAGRQSAIPRPGRAVTTPTADRVHGAVFNRDGQHGRL
jgi:small subunit ribosomal protein S3